MIPIKIDGKKYKIKTIPELTTREFVDLLSIEELDPIKYIVWQTGIKDEDIFFANISKSVIQAIGQIPDVAKLPRSDRFDYSATVETLGQRHQVEACGKDGFELLTYTLAVAMAHSNNIDDVNKLYEAYLDQPFAEILPAGFFFFKILTNGRSKGRKLLNWLRVLMKMKRSR